MNLTELLDETASRWPKKAALVEGNIIVSYAELADRISALSSQLKEAGVIPHSRVGVCFPNSVNHVALTFALWRINAIVVPIPTECSNDELTTIAEAMRLEVVLSWKPVAQSVAIQSDIFLNRLVPKVTADNHQLEIAFIRFTSGTTSARKGVVLCHNTVYDRVKAANKALRIGPEDTVVWCLPMSHHFLVTIVLYLSQGATIVLARHVLARPFLEAINRWSGTVLYAAPFHYGLLARDGSGLSMPSVRLAVSTTCSLSQEVSLSFHQRFGLALTQALGVMELGLVCMNLDDPLGRWNSVGPALPDFAVNIRDPDSEGCGELMVAGPGLFDGYDDPWVSREQLMPDGWFATGDLGRMDSDGFLYLVGRKVAVINLAGRKVFPEEIEAVLNRHPAVRESRVYGMAHPHLGEVIEAEVALHSIVEPEILREFCRAHVSADKVPCRIHIITKVSRTAVTGKIRREFAPPVS
jgi:long-chain acyl-CoA synthetase